MPMAWRWPMCAGNRRPLSPSLTKRLTEEREIARLIARLPELVELERDRTRPRAGADRHRYAPTNSADLASDGKLLEVERLQVSRHLHIEPLALGLPKRLPMPDVANHLVCSVCGARNDDLKRPIRARQMQRFQG